MDNQQDQFGAANPNNTGRTNQNPATTPGVAGASRSGASNAADNTASGSAPASRKPTNTPDAQNPSGALNQSNANADSNRQGEGQQANDNDDNPLNSALQGGKKWIENSGVLNGMNHLPQNIKNFSNRAVARVSDLSTTQKVVGGAILVVGLGWLATRKSKSSDSSSSYNYGRQRDAGSYGRRNTGYQTPDASTSRRPAGSTSDRTDSGSPYGNSGSSYASGASASQTQGSNTGIRSGSGRSDSGTGFGASANTDHGAQTPEGNSRSKNDDFRNSPIE